MHDLTQTILDENTKITTSKDSYVFTCPACDKQARYAYSFDDKEEVFCNGEDFSTKVPAGGIVLEVRDATYLLASDQGKLKDASMDVLEQLEAIDILTIETEDTETTDENGDPITVQATVGLLTEFGLSVLEELK